MFHFFLSASLLATHRDNKGLGTKLSQRGPTRCRKRQQIPAESRTRTDQSSRWRSPLDTWMINNNWELCCFIQSSSLFKLLLFLFKSANGFLYFILHKFKLNQEIYNPSQCFLTCVFLCFHLASDMCSAFHASIQLYSFSSVHE